MKLIINASILDKKPTGIGIYTFNILKEFTSKQIKYTYYSSLINKNNESNIYISKYVRPYPYRKFGGLLRFILNQTYFTYKAKNYKIAYLPTPHGSLFLNNQIITVHDLLALHFPKQHRLQYYYYKYFMPIILRKSKMVIAISESTKNDLINFYNLPASKIRVIYNGFNKDHFNYKSNAEEYIYNKYKIKNYLFCSGSSYPHKNINVLIEAFSKINDDTISLVITGHIVEYQNEIIKRLKLKNVIFIGFVDFNDLPYFYSGARAMVYPSLYEGFGFPPLEAMSCHCPVIASNISSIPEVCGNAVEYIDPYKVESITNAINKIVSNSSYKSFLIEQGLNQIKKFNWGKTADEIIKLFKETDYE
jgi:glycosyltransferase involved in cell wall biosynthesis